MNNPRTPDAQPDRKQQLISTHEEDPADGNGKSFEALPSLLASFLLNTSMILILALVVLKTTKEATVSLEAGEIDSVSVEDNTFNLENLEFDDSDVLEQELADAPSESVSAVAEPLSHQALMVAKLANYHLRIWPMKSEGEARIRVPAC